MIPEKVKRADNTMKQMPNAPRFLVKRWREKSMVPANDVGSS